MGPRIGGAAVLAAVLTLTVMTSTAAAVPRCAVRGHRIAGVRHSRVVRASGPVVVYRVRGNAADTWWACRRGARRRALIGQDDSFQGDLEYGPSTVLSGLQIAGEWVMVTNETGGDQAAACSKYQQYPCLSPVDTLVVANVGPGASGPLASIQTQAEVGTPDSGGTVTLAQWTPTLISSSGAVAWLESARTYVGTAPQPSATSIVLSGCLVTVRGRRLACAPRLLSSGQVDASSLMLSGATLSWTEQGQARSAVLARA